MDKKIKISDKLEKYKGLVFDLDGTIVDLGVDWKLAKSSISDYLFEKKGERYEFAPLGEKLFEAKKKFGKNVFLDLLKILRRFEAGGKRDRINTNLVSLINGLGEKKIAIYSMNTRKTILNIIKKYVRVPVDIIVSIDDCTGPKPTDKDLIKIITDWKLRKKEVLYVGNSKIDSLCGIKAGIDTHILNF